MDTGFEWIARYGYAGIFLLLMLGIVGLPVPDETLLTFVGYLSFKGDLAFLPSVAAAFLGSSTGISLSYGVGRVAGSQVVTKLSHRLHLSPEHLARGQIWLQRWGKYALVIAYFVPGVRHLVALLAGASSLPLQVFAPFAYCGALLWSATFLAIGYSLGEEWHRQSPLVHRVVVILAVAVVSAILIGLLIIRRRGKIGLVDNVKRNEGNPR
jgi:membrane protein DedA with SNARE-associated domain